jgi:hypothetical protein
MLLLVAGCASQKTPSFNVIRLYNDTPGEISDVELSAGGSTTELARLPPGHSPTADRGVKPDPATATVNWRGADGRRVEKDVPIARNVPAGFHGVIVLLLKEDGDVALQFVPYADLK